jgi:hypothetical protein
LICPTCQFWIAIILDNFTYLRGIKRRKYTTSWIRNLNASQWDTIRCWQAVSSNIEEITEKYSWIKYIFFGWRTYFYLSNNLEGSRLHLNHYCNFLKDWITSRCCQINVISVNINSTIMSIQLTWIKLKFRVLWAISCLKAH